MKNQMKNYFNSLDNNKSVILKINILFLIFFMCYDSMSVTIPLYINDIKVGVSYYGTILAITLIIRSFIAIPLSNLNLKTKFKVLINVLVINCCSLILLMFMKNIFILTIVFIFFLSSVSVLNIIINPVLASISSKENYGLTFGIRDVFLFIGSALGLFLTGLIHNDNNYNIIFLFNIILLLLIVILIVSIKNNIESILKSTTIAKNNNEFNLSLKNKIKDNFSVIRNNDTFKYYCSLCVLLTVAASGFSYIPLLAQQYQISDKYIYYTMSTSLLISSILSIAGGKIIDKNNKKQIYLVYQLVRF